MMIGNKIKTTTTDHPYMLSKEARFFAAIFSLSDDIFKSDSWPFIRSTSGILTISDKFVILLSINPSLESDQFAKSGNNVGVITYISSKVGLYISKKNQINSEGNKTIKTKK